MNLPQRLLASRRQCYFRAFGKAGLDNPETDAAAGTGDYDHLAVQLQVHG